MTAERGHGLSHPCTRRRWAELQAVCPCPVCPTTAATGSYQGTHLCHPAAENNIPQTARERKWQEPLRGKHEAALTRPRKGPERRVPCAGAPPAPGTWP